MFGQGGASSDASASSAEEAAKYSENPGRARRRKLRGHRKKLVKALKILPVCVSVASVLCNEGHPLVELHGEDDDEYRFCDNCNARDLEHTWSCPDCDYDICNDCHGTLS
uniref:ZZ-type domain-containing protein n=1 Tax=Spumella elongata TaxID=89044 RepID=A0A7S3HAV8_9STRA